MRDVKMEADPNPAHIFFWWRVLGGIQRKGEWCRVLARGRKNSILVEFQDGFRVVTSRYAVRKVYD